MEKNLVLKQSTSIVYCWRPNDDIIACHSNFRTNHLKSTGIPLEQSTSYRLIDTAIYSIHYESPLLHHYTSQHRDIKIIYDSMATLHHCLLSHLTSLQAVNSPHGSRYNNSPRWRGHIIVPPLYTPPHTQPQHHIGG